jgi:hypothetical protein
VRYASSTGVRFCLIRYSSERHDFSTPVVLKHIFTSQSTIDKGEPPVNQSQETQICIRILMTPDCNAGVFHIIQYLRLFLMPSLPMSVR